MAIWGYGSGLALTVVAGLVYVLGGELNLFVTDGLFLNKDRKSLQPCANRGALLARRPCRFR